VFGHRLLILAHLLEDACRAEDDARQWWPETGDDARWRGADLLSREAIKAVPHLWSRVGWSKATELDMPQHVISPRSLPLPSTWHTFAYLSGSHSDARTEVLDGVLIHDLKTKMAVADFWSIRAGRLWETRVGLSQIPYGSVWPDDFAGRPRKIRQTLQLLAFLSSPFIPRTHERMSRAARRQVARKGADVDAEDTVTFVLLRRMAEGRRNEPETETEVEWKHRWLVSGHLRAQWYPSEGAHHLIWIAPYVKGPEDAPLLEHVYRVAR